MILRDVLERDPGNVDATVNLGLAFFGMRRYGQARETFERVLELEPGAKVARVFLARLDEVQPGSAGAESKP